MFRFTIRDVVWLIGTVVVVCLALQVDHMLWWQSYHKSTRSLRKHIHKITDEAMTMEHESG